MNHLVAPQVILVPQGAEAKAVNRGLGKSTIQPMLATTPMGISATQRTLETLWQQKSIVADASLVLIGLGGSLAPQHQIGEVILCQACVYQDSETGLQRYACDRTLTETLHTRLAGSVKLGTVLTSDRFIASAAEKQYLGQTHNADVVDMEGAGVFSALRDRNIAIAMLRVISDDCHHDLIDLAGAIAADGTLKTRAMAGKFLRHPLAALQLIQGSLHGLKVLEQLAEAL